MVVLATIAVVCAQTLLGSALWWLLRRGRRLPLIELLSVGSVIGLAIAVLIHQLLNTVTALPWAVLTWCAVLVALGVLLLIRRRHLPRITLPTSWDLAALLLVSGLTILLLVPTIMATRHALAVVDPAGYSGDLIFLEALSRSLATYGPFDSVFLADLGMRYHGLAYAWSGLLTQLVQAPAFTTITITLPLFTAFSLTALVITWARLLSPVRWVPLLAGLVTVVGAYAGAEQGVLVIFDSPSNGFGSLLLLASAITLTIYFRNRLNGWAIALAALLGFATMAAKASHGVVLVAGLAVAALMATMTPYPRRVWAVAGATGLGALLAYVVLLAGISSGTGQIGVASGRPHASTWQGLDPMTGPWGVALGTAAFLLAILPRWIGILGLLRTPHGSSGRSGRSSWRAPELPFGLGAAAVGLAALIVLSSGVNDAWFALASTSVLGVLSAVGIGRVAAGRGPRFWCSTIAIAVIATAAAALLFALATVSQTPTLWRTSVAVWAVCVLGGLIGCTFVRSETSAVKRWGVITMTALVLTTIGTRFTGQASWPLLQPVLQPGVERIIRLVYPQAEFTGVRPPVEPPVSPGQSPVLQQINAFRDNYEFVYWSPEKQVAAQWVATHLATEDLMATDNPIQQPFLPAITGNRLLVAGIPYVLGYAPASSLSDLYQRMQLVQEFIATPTPRTQRALTERGVRWLWMENSLGRGQDFAGLAQDVFNNAEVRIVELAEPTSD